MAAEENTTAMPDQEPASAGFSWINVIGGLAAALIAGGIVIVAAINGAEMAPGLRLGTAMLPLLGALFGGGLVICLEPGAFWRESAAVLIAVAFGTVVAVIAEVYYSIESAPEFLSWVLPPVAGLVYLFSSHFLATIYVLVLGVGFYQAAFYDPASFFWSNLLVAALIMPYLKRMGDSRTSAFAAQWGRLLMIVVAVMMLFRILNRQDSFSIHFFVWSVFLLNFFLAGLASRRATRFNSHLFTGGVGMLLFVFIFAGDSGYYRRLATSFQEFDPVEVVTWVAALGVYAWNILQALLKRRPVQYLIGLFLPGLALFSTLLPILTLDYVPILRTLFNLYLTAIGVSAFYLGLRWRRPLGINIGIIALGGQLFLLLGARYDAAGKLILLAGLLLLVVVVNGVLLQRLLKRA